MKYDAFISYSHSADIRLAPALHTELQRLAKPWYRLRAIRVFRDETDLGASPGLWPTIDAALTNSENLIFMASPEAAASKWVARELERWLELGRADKLFIVLTKGEIVWGSTGDFDWQVTSALPKTLSGVFEVEPH